MRKPILILTIAALSYSITARPDHLPENLVARTKSEHVLAGFDVWRGTYKTPQTLNAAARVVERWPNEGCSGKDCGGEEEVSWEGRGCIIRVWGMYPGPNEIRGVVGVEVVPSVSGSGRGCTTGRGLALSDPFRKAITLYGERYFVTRKDRGEGMSVLYEWQDGGQMDLDMDRNGKITKIGLSPSE
jgi:hypothetical protein